ncbi:hypothetical protein UA08_04256 [Talaromyces atroroseus]|uniref:AB hydrolase-1 domain-containing protein n=1 Tax=Talaromyces atroroseus TaxID=1441469 RepID=A0A1Q5Q992_TALAT|nr:hypothetical protein UA08_04256 [Talaromyces atroroseus]OKL60697.1 hypothetical protein UA08_04256 [Talaromyces atroroseus]
MSQTKPYIVLVPGAWHTPVHYQELTALLEEAGYPVKTTKLPSVASNQLNKESVVRDSNTIREKLLLPLLDEGKDVILLMHSYGGCPGAAAAKGLGKTERKTGRSIIGLVFLAAFLAREGNSLLSALHGKFDRWVVINDETGQLDVENPIQVFYHDVPRDKASIAAKEIKLHSKASLSTPSTPSAWGDSDFDGRRAYIRALDDRAILPVTQEMMLKYSGVEWKVREMNTSHSPFLPRPRETADIILDIISEL